MIIKKNNVSKETIDYIKVYSLREKKIAIPIFQRLYEWKKKTSEALINDIMAMTYETDKQFYLLDFIGYNEDGFLKLADGQQRIITLNILIKVINDVIDLEDLQIDKIQLFDITYDIKESNAKYQECFIKNIGAPFKEVYVYFRDEFIIPNKEKIADIIRVIKNDIYIYLKTCLTPDDAYAIFTQINMGGKGLTKDDVMKTSINQYANIYQIPFNPKNKLLKETITSYYKFITDDTAGNFDNLTLLTFIKKYITCDRDSFIRFTNVYQNIENKKHNPFYTVFSYIMRPTLGDVLNVLALKNVDLNKDKDNYKEKVIIPLCLISINMSLTKSTPTDMRYLLKDVIDMIKNDKSASDISAFIEEYIGNHNSIRIPVNTFSQHIGSPDTKEGIKKALLIIDIIFRSKSSTIDFEKINLEHIYPKKPGDYWRGKGWPELEEKQKAVIHSIGNYLILNEAVNKSIKNKYIDEKIPEYEKIIKLDSTLQTEMNTVDFEEFKNDKDKYVIKRQLSIANKVRELPFGSNLIVDDE